MNRRITLLSVLVLIALACSITTPSTPEPAGSPDAPEAPAVLQIVYTETIDGGSNLWLIRGAEQPRQLTSNGRDDRPTFSGDGQMVAFLRRIEAPLWTEELWVVNADGSGERPLVDADWLSSAKPEVGTTMYNYQWVPGTHWLAFTVQEVHDGVGIALIHNLYLVNADDGQMGTSLPLPEDALLFSYSPDGSRIAVSASSWVGTMNADGSNWREQITFQGAGLGDGPFVPDLVWSPAGDYLRFATLINGVLQPGVDLWNIPADAEAGSKIGSLLDGNGVNYAPDLQHISYFTRPDSASSTAELHLANGDGTGSVSYLTGPALRWLGWAPDSRRFIYSMDGVAYLGEIGATPRQLFSDVSTVHTPVWAGDNLIIFRAGSPEHWELRQGAPGGASTLLASPRGDWVLFEISD